MPYSAEVVRRARARLAQAKEDRESENRQHLAEAYARVPRLKEIDIQLRRTMAQAAQAAFLQGSDGRELMEKAMRYAAGRTRRQVAGSLASGMSRVAENGGRSIAVTASDPRGLTSEDLADIRRRVLDGEKIRF